MPLLELGRSRTYCYPQESFSFLLIPGSREGRKRWHGVSMPPSPISSFCFTSPVAPNSYETTFLKVKTEMNPLFFSSCVCDFTALHKILSLPPRGSKFSFFPPRLLNIFLRAMCLPTSLSVTVEPKKRQRLFFSTYKFGRERAIRQDVVIGSF